MYGGVTSKQGPRNKKNTEDDDFSQSQISPKILKAKNILREHDSYSEQSQNAETPCSENNLNTNKNKSKEMIKKHNSKESIDSDSLNSKVIKLVKFSQKVRAKRLWSQKEDKAIDQLVKKYGNKKWSLIAKNLELEYHICGRNGKQCRER